MASSQNGVCPYTLSIQKKTIIMQIMTKKVGNFYLFNLLSQRNCKIRSFYDTFLELCKHRFVTQPLQNPPFCSMQHHIFPLRILQIQKEIIQSPTLFLAYMKVFTTIFAKTKVLAKHFQSWSMACLAYIDVPKWWVQIYKWAIDRPGLTLANMG